MPNRFFPSAREARLNSRNTMEIFREIRAIEEQILIASAAGELEVTVDTTRMTFYEMTPEDPDAYVAEEFFNVWKNESSLPASKQASFEEQMKTVMTYFKDLGYSIHRRVSNSNVTFVWVVKW